MRLTTAKSRMALLEKFLNLSSCHPIGRFCLHCSSKMLRSCKVHPCLCTLHRELSVESSRSLQNVIYDHFKLLLAADGHKLTKLYFTRAVALCASLTLLFSAGREAVVGVLRSSYK